MMTAKRSVLAAAVAVCGGFLAVPASAQGGDSARLNAILACNRIDKKSARLACYDAQAEGAPAQPAAAPPRDVAGAPLAAAPAAPSASYAPTPSFGRVERTRRSRPQEVRQVVARAVSAVDDGIGRYTITLDDGARWRMTEIQPGFAPPRANDEVRIRKGALGSFLMDVNKQGSVRVERIQ